MTNPYAPPRDATAQDEQPIGRTQRSAQFYDVSIATLSALQLVTFGLYAVYWFYRHWAVQKRARRLNISPLARGIFAIFFVHRLFKAIDDGALGRPGSCRLGTIALKRRFWSCSCSSAASPNASARTSRPMGSSASLRSSLAWCL